jgi:hypothetical protein
MSQIHTAHRRSFNTGSVIVTAPEPKRIQRHRSRGWRMPADAMYVGRPSRWGNPFRIYQGNSVIGPQWSVARDTWSHIPADQAIHGYITSSSPLGNERAVALFHDLLAVRRREEPERLRQWLAPLRGRDLACWCALGQPCHADVLLDLANWEAVA